MSHAGPKRHLILLPVAGALWSQDWDFAGENEAWR